MKVKIQAFVHWHKYTWDEAEFRVSWDDMSKCGPGWILIGKQEIEAEIPDDFDPRPQQIKILREQKQEILAKAHVQAENLEEQIQKLLALEDKS